MFSLKKNKEFISQRDVVICYLIHKDNILFLKRGLDKFKGGMWTAPGGKRENNESLENAVIREILEETDISIDKENLSYIDKCYIKHDNFHFTMHIFKTHLNQIPQINLNTDENIEYAWASINDAKKLNLIEHAIDCLNFTFK
ncbi:MAG: NADH pyrophosphatase [Candidatus Anoxychlamydiales bacterium]|nr:NADH pyrophosphatase [Candidatus Anoxychlamydiales bacterium]